MINIYHWAKKTKSILPECYIEWVSLYKASIISKLIENDLLVFADKYDFVEDVYLEEKSYKISLISGRYLGSDKEDNVRQFTQKEVRNLTLNERALAKYIAKSIGLKNPRITPFSFGCDGFYLGEFGNNKTRYPVYLCFNFVNFDRELALANKNTNSNFPIIFAFDSNIQNSSVNKALRENNAKIFDLFQAFEITENILECKIALNELLNLSKGKSKESFKSYDVWRKDFPYNPTWKDVKIEFVILKSSFKITYGNEEDEFNKDELSFFEGENSKLWILFEDILQKKAKSTDPTQKRYVSELNKCFNKFFNLKGNPFSSRGNNSIYKPIFDLTINKGKSSYRREENQVEYNENIEEHNSDDDFFTY